MDALDLQIIIPPTNFEMPNHSRPDCCVKPASVSYYVSSPLHTATLRSELQCSERPSPPDELPRHFETCTSSTSSPRRERQRAEDVSTREIVFRALGSSEMVELLPRAHSQTAPTGTSSPRVSYPQRSVEPRMQDTSFEETCLTTQTNGAHTLTQNTASGSRMDPSTYWFIDETVYARAPDTEVRKSSLHNPVLKGL